MENFVSFSEPANITAVAAIFLSFVGIILSWQTSARQRRHQRLSVKPIGKFTQVVNPYGGKIVFTNGGLGPLILKTVTIEDTSDRKRDPITEVLTILREAEKSARAEWNGRIRWHVGHRNIDHYALTVGEEMRFFEWSFVPFDETADPPAEWRRYQKLIRNLLAKAKVTVAYTDVYGSRRTRLTLDGSETSFADAMWDADGTE